jgi:hypothetical protein
MQCDVSSSVRFGYCPDGQTVFIDGNNDALGGKDLDTEMAKFLQETIEDQFGGE